MGALEKIIVNHFIHQSGTSSSHKRINEQHKWRMLHNEKLKKLKEQLLGLEKQLSQDKSMLPAASTDLEVKNELLPSSLETLRKTRAKLLEKYYQNFNCTQNLGHVSAFVQPTLNIQQYLIH